MPKVGLKVAALLLALSLALTGTAFATSDRYTVVKGDTLYLIAKKYATTVDELKRLNGLTSDNLQIGQELTVKAPAAVNTTYVEYIVQRGDTLGKIAETFGTKTEFIKSLNGLTSDLIYVGAVLKIPAEYVEHTVKSGDTLYLLAKQYGTTVARIKMFSAITSDSLNVGQKLKIPKQNLSINPPTPPTAGPSVSYKNYTVVKGDTVWGVAVKFGIPMSELLKDNGLNTSSTLNIGQSLRIAVHTVPVKTTPGSQYGENLDWWTEAQYVFPINKVAKVTDFKTGKTFNIRRTIGASHADCEPMTAADTATMKSLYGGIFSWIPRAVIIEVDGRRIAASMSFYPHGVEYVSGNNFDGHFDVYFSNCLRHVDNLPDSAHQAQVNIAAGK